MKKVKLLIEEEYYYKLKALENWSENKVFLFKTAINHRFEDLINSPNINKADVDKYIEKVRAKDIRSTIEKYQ